MRGELILLERVKEDVKWQKLSVYLCYCGKKFITSQYKVKNGSTTSCGCYQKDQPPGLKHGLCNIPEYKVWLQMKDRCRNKNNRAYKNYGGRGIRFCERWHKFENFIKDMGERPSPRHSIDRINNNGNYEPSNCRWATRSEQRKNMRPYVSVTFNGVTKSLTEWRKLLGVANTTYHRRKSNLNLSPEDTILNIVGEYKIKKVLSTINNFLKELP